MTEVAVIISLALIELHRLTANLVNQFYAQFPEIAPIYFSLPPPSVVFAGIWAIPYALSIVYLVSTRRRA